MALIRGLMVLMAVALASFATGAEQRTLRVGKISDNPKEDIAGLRPLLDYVVEQLAPVGIEGGEIVLARDIRQMISYLRQGKVDWTTETMGAALILTHRSDTRIALLRHKYGEEQYRSVIFTRTDSPVRTLQDLRGRTISFEHMGSTSGFIVPAIELRRAGLTIALMASPTEQPPDDMVGYLFFSDDEINTSTWVHKKLVDAGASANTDFSRGFQVPDAFRDELRVIFESSPLPRSVELFSNAMSDDLTAALREVLLQADQSEAGRTILERFQETSRYRPYDPQDWPYANDLWPDLQRLQEEVF